MGSRKTEIRGISGGEEGKTRGKLSIPEAELRLQNMQVPPELKPLMLKPLSWKEEDDMFNVMEYELLQSSQKHTTGET
jgi:hypothetical protein